MDKKGNEIKYETEVIKKKNLISFSPREKNKVMKTKMSTKTTELRMIMEDLKRKLVRRMMMKMTKMIMMKMMLMKMMRKRKKSSNHLPKNNKKNE